MLETSTKTEMVLQMNYSPTNFNISSIQYFLGYKKREKEHVTLLVKSIHKVKQKI